MMNLGIKSLIAAAVFTTLVGCQATQSDTSAQLPSAIVKAVDNDNRSDNYRAATNIVIQPRHWPFLVLSQA